MVILPPPESGLALFVRYILALGVLFTLIVAPPVLASPMLTVFQLPPAKVVAPRVKPPPLPSPVEPMTMSLPFGLNTAFDRTTASVRVLPLLVWPRTVIVPAVAVAAPSQPI